MSAAVRKIRTPVLGFTGESVGVHFDNGIGYTDDPAALAYFERAGYVVDGDDRGAPPAAPVETGPAQPKRSGSAAAWRTWAVEAGNLTADQAAELSRDQLVERFASSKEDEQ